jgi:hypothetical protein
MKSLSFQIRAWAPLVCPAPSSQVCTRMTTATSRNWPRDLQGYLYSRVNRMSGQFCNAHGAVQNSSARAIRGELERERRDLCGTLSRFVPGHGDDLALLTPLQAAALAREAAQRLRIL